MLAGAGNKIELIIVAQLDTCYVHNFLCVTAEMGNRLDDGLHAGDVITLNESTAEKFFLADRFQCFACLGSNLFQQPFQLRDRLPLFQRRLDARPVVAHVTAHAGAGHDDLPLGIPHLLARAVCHGTRQALAEAFVVWKGAVGIRRGRPAGAPPEFLIGPPLKVKRW